MKDLKHFKNLREINKLDSVLETTQRLAARLFQTLTTRSLKWEDLTRIVQLFLYNLKL